VNSANLPDDSRKLQELWEQLCAWFSPGRAVVVAFSGGVDSSLVLRAAADSQSGAVVAVTADSPSLPRAELAACRALAAELGVTHLVRQSRELESESYRKNDGSRCYSCKSELYSVIGRLLRDAEFRAELERSGVHPDSAIVVDGLNSDDLSDERPGRRAADEAGVRHPLVEIGLGKTAVRALARAAGLSNWNKPAMACLSSRIPRGTTVTVERLSMVEKAEAILVDRGLAGGRVRLHVLPGEGEPKLARIELPPEGLGVLVERGVADFASALREIGFQFVTLDLEGYRLGGRIS
jgi:uncharacterized protein